MKSSALERMKEKTDKMELERQGIKLLLDAKRAVAKYNEIAPQHQAYGLAIVMTEVSNDNASAMRAKYEVLGQRISKNRTRIAWEEELRDAAV